MCVVGQAITILPCLRVQNAPSDYILIGRYVLTPDVFDEIDRLQPGSGGELQLTDALRAQARRAPFHAVLSRVARYDTGTPLGFLEASIAFALRDPSMGASVRELLGTFTQGVSSRV